MSRKIKTYFSFKVISLLKNELSNSVKVFLVLYFIQLFFYKEFRVPDILVVLQFANPQFSNTLLKSYMWTVD